MSHLCDYARDGVGSALMMALRVPGWKSLEAFFRVGKKGVSVRVLPSCFRLFLLQNSSSVPVPFFDKCNKLISLL